MPGQLLGGPRWGPAHGKMRAEGVSKGMHTVVVYPSPTRGPLHAIPHHLLGERTAGSVGEGGMGKVWRVRDTKVDVPNWR